MNREDQHTSTVEQSWIVLDDNGWSISRPPTATSPSRPSPKLENDDDEDDEIDTNVSRRIGMDRDVREALELAERSLELAASAEECIARSHRDVSDDESSTQRSSPGPRMVLGNVYMDDALDDRYNGRGPPVIIGNSRRGLNISTDSEHVAFQNIKLVSSSSRSSTPVLSAVGGGLSKEPISLSQPQTASIGNTPNRSFTTSSVSRPQTDPAENYSCNDLKRDDDDENEGSFLNWVFGPNFVPLVFSHAVTLLIGFYIGNRRSSITTSTSTPSSTPSPTGSNA